MSITKETLINALQLYKNREDAYNANIFVAKVAGKGLSTNDFDNTYKTKIDGIADGAQVNVIETVTIDNVAQTVSGKGVTLDLSQYAKKSDITGAMNFKGTIENYAKLTTEGVAEIGNVYNIQNTGGTDANGTAVKAGDQVAYTASGWVVISSSVDLSNYVQTSQLTNYVIKVEGKTLSSNDFTDAYKNKIDSMSADETISDADIAALFA